MTVSLEALISVMSLPIESYRISVMKISNLCKKSYVKLALHCQFKRKKIVEDERGTSNEVIHFK